MVEIFYNGINPFNGLAPTPLVSKTDTMIQAGERWGVLSNITLNGEITGVCENFAALITKQRTLLTRFSKDFQEFSIKEGATTVFSNDFAIIRSVSFPENKYVALVPFSISIDCYPSNLFEGTYGVINPAHQIDYSENRDGTINITHVVSAQGFNTSRTTSNALSNAKSFVQGLTGFSSQVLPQFFSLGDGFAPCLRSISENVDRLNATYSVSEQYLYDPQNEDSADVLRYTMSFESGLTEGVCKVSVKGQIEGCRNQDFSEVRERYSGFDAYATGNSFYQDVTSTAANLNPEYLTHSINEDSQNKRLSFDVAYDDDSSPTVYLDYRSSVNTDELRQVTSFSFEGTIRARGDLKTRWERVNDFFAGMVLIDYVTGAYASYNYDFELNPIPLSSGTTFNQFIGEISTNVSFDNRPIPPSGLDKFDYSISVTPSINKYVSSPLVNPPTSTSGYAVYDLEYKNRQLVSVNGTAVVNIEKTISEGIAIITGEIDDIKTAYAAGSNLLLEQSEITTGNAGQNSIINFNVAWSTEVALFDIT